MIPSHSAAMILKHRVAALRPWLATATILVCLAIASAGSRCEHACEDTLLVISSLGIALGVLNFICALSWAASPEWVAHGAGFSVHRRALDDWEVLCTTCGVE